MRPSHPKSLSSPSQGRADRSPPRLVALVLAIVVFGIAGPNPSRGQSASATLQGWREESQQALRDRRNGKGGIFFDRGVFRRLTYEMDFEYDPDELVYRFNPLADGDFYRHDIAVRSYVGSINTTRFVAQSQFRAHVDPGSRSRVEITFRQQSDLRARRLFVEMGYLHRISRYDRVGASLTLEEYKADLDFKEKVQEEGEALSENLSKSLLAIFKETLGDKVEDVIVSKRLVDSAVTLVVGKQGMDKHCQGKGSGCISPGPSIVIQYCNIKDAEGAARPQCHKNRGKIKVFICTVITVSIPVG